jgi:hypothetical protein
MVCIKILHRKDAENAKEIKVLTWRSLCLCGKKYFDFEGLK